MQYYPCNIDDGIGRLLVFSSTTGYNFSVSFLFNLLVVVTMKWFTFVSVIKDVFVHVGRYAFVNKCLW